MKKTIPTLLIETAFILIVFGSGFSGYGQATVFSDDFTISTGTSYTTSAGAIGTSTNWSLSRSGADFGAKITLGNLTLTNDPTASANVLSWPLVLTSYDIEPEFLQLINISI